MEVSADSIRIVNELFSSYGRRGDISLTSLGWKQAMCMLSAKATWTSLLWVQAGTLAYKLVCVCHITPQTDECNSSYLVLPDFTAWWEFCNSFHSAYMQIIFLPWFSSHQGQEMVFSITVKSFLHSFSIKRYLGWGRKKKFISTKGWYWCLTPGDYLIKKICVTLHVL